MCSERLGVLVLRIFPMSGLEWKRPHIHFLQGQPTLSGKKDTRELSHCDSGPATDIGVLMGKCLVPRYDTHMRPPSSVLILPNRSGEAQGCESACKQHKDGHSRCG